MNGKTLVSVITPTNRPENIRRTIDIFLAQDCVRNCDIFDHTYELIIVDDNPGYLEYAGKLLRVKHIHGSGTIGNKRNIACQEAQGEIIFHLDDDDWCSPDFLSRSYNHLIASGADVTGLSSAYFYQPHTKMWKYEYTGVQKYVIGSGMMYYKRIWQRRPFPDQQIGEDAAFLANAGCIIPHNYINGFLAMIHGRNTNSHTQTPYMKRVSPEIAKDILGVWYGRY